MGFPDPTPEYSVRELTYAVTHGADNTGGRRNPAPGTPTSLFCKPGGEEVSSPPDPYFSVPEDSQNKFQTMGNVFPSIVPSVKIRIPKEFWKKSLEGGSGGTCFQRFPPNVSPIMQNQKWGWKGVFDSTIFIPLTVGVRT